MASGLQITRSCHHYAAPEPLTTLISICSRGPLSSRARARDKIAMAKQHAQGCRSIGGNFGKALLAAGAVDLKLGRTVRYPLFLGSHSGCLAHFPPGPRPLLGELCIFHGRHLLAGSGGHDFGSVPATVKTVLDSRSIQIRSCSTMQSCIPLIVLGLLGAL